jgi:hypothetical protein
MPDSSRARWWIHAAVFLFLAIAVARTTADVDLWGHVLFGRDIVNSHAIPAVDPYAFTSDRPWINHEWLAESIMYLSYRGLGPAGLVTLRLVVIGLIAMLVGVSVRREQISEAGRDALIMLGVILTSARTQHVRPQLFSVLLFAVLLLVLTRVDERRRAALWVVPPLMALWANLHGGWMVGLGTFGLWSAVEFVRERAWRGRAHLAGVVLLSTLATLVNPYGWGLWQFLWTTVGVGRADIEEWAPITTIRPGVLALWLTAVLLAVWTAVKFRRASRWNDSIVVAALGLLSWRVSRLDAFFALSVVMLLQPRLLRGLGAAAATTSPRRRLLRAAALPLFVAVATPVVFAGMRRPLSCIEMDRLAWLPESGAVEFARANQLQGRMMTFFDWGEYAIWHLSPGIKVSIDGRRETAYSQAQIDRHLRIYSDVATDAEIQEVAADYVWFPRNLQVVERFARYGWRPVYTGRVSVILARRTGGKTYRQVAPGPDQARCFPGP